MIRALLFVVLLMLATPVHAQLSTGSSGYSSAPREASMEEYWSMLGQMGTCLAETKTEESQAFVATVIDSSAEGEAFDALFHRSRNNCMGNFVRAGIVRSHLRGVVAEGLFEDLPDELVEALFASHPAGPESIATLHDFARCYVIAHPQAARDLLRETRLSTDGELAYVQSIADDLGPCLPQDREVRLNPTTMRMAIAEALYRAATGSGVAQIQGRN